MKNNQCGLNRWSKANLLAAKPVERIIGALGAEYLKPIILIKWIKESWYWEQLNR